MKLLVQLAQTNKEKHKKKTAVLEFSEYESIYQ